MLIMSIMRKVKPGQQIACYWMCCAVPCCAVLCCAVLCCAALCCAVLCCAVLCCVCCTVLCLKRTYLRFHSDVSYQNCIVVCHPYSSNNNDITLPHRHYEVLESHHVSLDHSITWISLRCVALCVMCCVLAGLSSTTRQCWGWGRATGWVGIQCWRAQGMHTTPAFVWLTQAFTALSVSLVLSLSLYRCIYMYIPLLPVAFLCDYPLHTPLIALYLFFSSPSSLPVTLPLTLIPFPPTLCTMWYNTVCTRMYSTHTITHIPSVITISPHHALLSGLITSNQIGIFRGERVLDYFLLFNDILLHPFPYLPIPSHPLHEDLNVNCSMNHV